MFCTKLKELKISGECPFSSSVKTNQLEHSEQPSTDAAHFPTSKDVHRNTDEDAPHQKSSRAKVNLHTLGESIRKLACPEVRKKKYTPQARFYGNNLCCLQPVIIFNQISERLAKR